MKPLKLPIIKVDDVFIKCVQSYRDTALKNSLMSVLADVKSASLEFEALASMHGTHRFTEKIAGKGIVSAQELQNVYKDKLLKKPGREYYEQLISTPKNSQCPLCDAREVRTLDHYLAKSLYPSLSVTPANLIPACRDCNMDRNVVQFTSTDDETLNPYYDDISQHRWLYCDLVQTDPPTFNYSIKMIGTLDKTMFYRIQKHFSTFKLGNLYSIRAAVEFTSCFSYLRKIHANESNQGVRSFIIDQLNVNEAISLNSWKSAFLRALLDSEWFFDSYLLQSHNL